MRAKCFIRVLSGSLLCTIRGVVSTNAMRVCVFYLTFTAEVDALAADCPDSVMLTSSHYLSFGFVSSCYHWEDFYIVKTTMDSYFRAE